MFQIPENCKRKWKSEEDFKNMNLAKITIKNSKYKLVLTSQN